jgi:hypothetical protein
VLTERQAAHVWEIEGKKKRAAKKIGCALRAIE